MGYAELEDPFAITENLVYKFGIPPGRVSQLFHEWTDVMFREFEAVDCMARLIGD